MGKEKLYHGSIYEFDSFCENEIGKNTNSKDTKYGFYFAANKKTAESYLHESKIINETEFKKRFNMSLKDSEEKVKNSVVDFESKYKIKIEELESSFLLRHKFKIEYQEFENDFNELLKIKKMSNPYSYSDSDPIIKEGLMGFIYEVEIEIDGFMIVDFNGTAWDENKQLIEAKKAMDSGYDGVVFKNMQDSGWFGGNCVDDVYLMFDSKNIVITGIYKYNGLKVFSEYIEKNDAFRLNKKHKL